MAVCVLRYVCFHLCVCIALVCAGGGGADPGPGPIFLYPYGLLRVIPAPFYPDMLSIQGRRTVYSMQLSKFIEDPCGKEIAQGGGGLCMTQVEG